MKGSPAFRFYPQDFISDLNVQSMTDEEVGKYIKLLCWCWIEDGLPVGWPLVEGWFNQSPTVRKCFVKKHGKYRNPRLDLEREKQVEWKEKSKIGGKESAKKRLDKSKGGSRVVQPKANSSLSLSLSLSDIKKENKSSLSGSPDATVLEVIEYLNQKTGKKFQPKNKETQAFIRARMKEGYDLEDFKRVIDNKVSKWKDDPKMADFLRPSTLFRPSHFEAYLNELPAGGADDWAAKKTAEMEKKK